METASKSLDNLSEQELVLYEYAESLSGDMDEMDSHLHERGIFDQYRNIHKSYLKLFFEIENEANKLEVLKRLIFLNWYALIEPNCYTGIHDLDESTVFESYAILNDYIIHHKMDKEFTWMLSYYSCWDFTILPFSESRLDALTRFVKTVDTTVLYAPKKQLPKGAMDNRGQMGVYWISCSVEEDE